MRNGLIAPLKMRSCPVCAYALDYGQGPEGWPDDDYHVWDTQFTRATSQYDCVIDWDDCDELMPYTCALCGDQDLQSYGVALTPR